MFKVQDTVCTNCDFCGRGGPRLCYVARTARYGLEGNFPTEDDKETRAFGRTQSSGDRFMPGVPRFKSMFDLVMVPELIGTRRVAKMAELGIEPLYHHCSTERTLGTFKVNTPIVIAAMGSTPVANLLGKDLGAGAAKGGFVYAIGENVMNMWGYSERIDESEPTLKERIMSFCENYQGAGGVVVQQNVEDARAGVWKRLYADPDLKPFFAKGIIGFESKGGQGAKPGMGGEVKLPRKHAQRLHEMYYFPVNPFDVEQALYQRHSVPGTMTEESLLASLVDVCEKYPDAPLWFKTGPYGDLLLQIQVLDQVAAQFGRRIHVTIDGTEGGTGMSPLGPMSEMGIPTLTCLQLIQKCRKEYSNLDYTIAGGLVTGRDMAKCLALGADGVAFGKPFLIAATAGRNHFCTKPDAGEQDLVPAGAQGIYNYTIEGVTNEAKMLITSLGKYDLASMCEEPYRVNGDAFSTIDVIATDKDVAAMFDLLYAYDPEFWSKMTAATAELRVRGNGLAVK